MIVPMARVRLYGPTELLDEVTRFLCEMGVFHLEPLPPALVSRVQVRDRRAEDREAINKRTELEGLYEKVRRSLTLLPPRKNGDTASGPRAPDVDPAAGEAPRIAGELFQRIESLSGRRKVAADRLSLLAKYQKMVSAILPLVERAGDAAHLEMVGLTISRAHEEAVGLLEEELKRATGGHVQVFSAAVDEHTLAALVLYGRSDAAKVRALLWDRNLSELKLPAEIRELPLKAALEEMADQGRELPEELQAIDVELAHLSATWRPWLETLNEDLAARLQQIGMRSSFFRTRYSFVIPGWIPVKSLAQLHRGIGEIAAGQIVVEELPVSRADERQAPVHLLNPSLIRPFEVFLRLLPLPVYRTVDPTWLLAFFFPLFFGLIVGDAGYGLAIAVLALLLRRHCATTGRMRDLATVVLYSSSAAVLFGLVFGEFFGTLGEAFGMRPLHPILNRVTSMPFFLGLGVGIGCLHVFLGLGLGMVNAIRTGHRAGLRHRVGQSAALAALILIVAALAGAVSRSLLAPAAILLLAGLAIWIAGGGFAAPIELLSTVGNVLSYARLMAVGLAGVILAMVANEIGSRTLWGVVAAVLLHLVNIVLCVFSPTIHAMRLHLVEFFTKFYETGGAEYKPLRRRRGV